MKYNNIKSLCVCNKSSYTKGEKKRFSGSMGHWIKEKHDDSTRLWFAYRQKKLVDIEEFVKDNPQYTNLYKMGQFRKLFHLAVNEGYYGYPIFSYFCEFMIISILLKDDNVFMNWASGDDEIGYDLDFSEKDVPIVKKFILDNYKSPNFGDLIVQFANKNNF